MRVPVFVLTAGNLLKVMFYYILAAMRAFFMAAVFLIGSLVFAGERYPFSDGLAEDELCELEAGTIVVRNIRTINKATMLRGVDSFADSLLDMFTELKPTYLAEIMYMVPIAGNANVIEQAVQVFSDYTLYKQVIYKDGDDDEGRPLFPEADLIQRVDGDNLITIDTRVRMDMLSPYNTQLVIKYSDDTFFFSQINQEPMKLGFITAVKPTKMQAAICCFQYGENWFVYALGGVKAPRIPLVRKMIEHQFISRIEDFTTFYIGRFDFTREAAKEQEEG